MAIEDDLMERPESYALLPGTNWRMLKTRPGVAGFPGLILYFSIESERGDDVCVLEDVDLSDDQTPQPLTDSLSGETLWGWAQGNGQH